MRRVALEWPAQEPLHRLAWRELARVHAWDDGLSLRPPDQPRAAEHERGCGCVDCCGRLGGPVGAW